MYMYIHIYIYICKGQVCLYYSFKTLTEVHYGTLHTAYIWISTLKKLEN